LALPQFHPQRAICLARLKTGPSPESIAVDPTDSSTVYAGTAHPYTGSNSERIFKSTDGGTTWAQTVLDAGSFPVDFIVVNPGRHAQVLAGSFGAGGLFQSLDAGATWTTIPTGAACGGIAGAAFDPAGATLYLAGSGGVCRSTDTGTTWTAASAGGLAVDSVLVDPSNPATLYAGTEPDLSTSSGGVFVSTDGGGTFSLLGSGFAPSPVRVLQRDSKTGDLFAGTVGAGVEVLLPEGDRATVVSPGLDHRPKRTLPPR